MNKQTILQHVVLTAVLGHLSISNASIVEYVYDGHVSNIQSAAAGALERGQRVEASVIYDTANVHLTRVFDSTNAQYEFLPDAFEITINVYDASGLVEYSGRGDFGYVTVLDGAVSGQDWLQPRSESGSVSGDAINGYQWRQIDMTLKNHDGSLYVDNSLPRQIAELNNFDEAFFSVTFQDKVNPALGIFGFNVQIDNIQAILSTAEVTQNIEDTSVEILAPSQDHGGGGGFIVDMPDGVEGAITVQFSQQAKDELGGVVFDFAIPGETYQLWDVHFDGDIPADELVEVTLSYDDTGMTFAEEFNLAIIRILDDGSLDGELKVVRRDYENNTITVLTPGFSSLGGVQGQSVPVPAPLALLGLGAAGIGWMRRKRAG